MKIGGIKLKYFIIVISVIAIAAGIYVTFFQSRGFEKTTATIKSIETTEGTEGEDYIVTVEYEVNGKSYVQQLDSYSDSYKVGKEVAIYYNPEDPNVIHSGGWMGIYMMGIGVLLLAGTILSGLKKKKDLAQLKEKQPETLYAPSVRGEERKLYFLTDRGTAKFGHRIEDADRNVLYDAKVTKFSLTTPIGFVFTDHEHNRTTEHLVGQMENTDWDTLLIDNHSTFSFDGEDIWKHLKRNGIRVESGFKEGKILRPEYRIFRNDQEIAYAETSSLNVHEEDAQAKGKLGDFIPARGYYRIRTTEQYLDLLFVTLMAFARTEANDGEGGSYGMLKSALGREK